MELGACVLSCLVVPLSGVESWKEALPLPTRMQDLGLREEAELLQDDGEEEEDPQWGRSAFRNVCFPGDTEMQGENPHVPQGLPWLAPSLPSPDLGQRI